MDLAIRELNMNQNKRHNILEHPEVDLQKSGKQFTESEEIIKRDSETMLIKMDGEIDLLENVECEGAGIHCDIQDDDTDEFEKLEFELSNNEIAELGKDVKLDETSFSDDKVTIDVISDITSNDKVTSDVISDVTSDDKDAETDEFEKLELEIARGTISVDIDEIRENTSKKKEEVEEEEDDDVFHSDNSLEEFEKLEHAALQSDQDFEEEAEKLEFEIASKTISSISKSPETYNLSRPLENTLEISATFSNHGDTDSDEASLNLAYDEPCPPILEEDEDYVMVPDQERRQLNFERRQFNLLRRHSDNGIIDNLKRWQSEVGRCHSYNGRLEVDDRRRSRSDNGRLETVKRRRSDNGRLETAERRQSERRQSDNAISQTSAIKQGFLKIDVSGGVQIVTDDVSGGVQIVTEDVSGGVQIVTEDVSGGAQIVMGEKVPLQCTEPVYKKVDDEEEDQDHVETENETITEQLRKRLLAMQEDVAKSDLVIAELNITIDDLTEYKLRLEADICKNKENESTDDRLVNTEDDNVEGIEQEIQRLQKEIFDRDKVIKTQRDALSKTFVSIRKDIEEDPYSLAGAVKQALDVNVVEMARMYKETHKLCRTMSLDPEGFKTREMKNNDQEFYESKLDELDQKHYELIEDLETRHNEEIQTLKEDYEVLIQLAVKEKEEDMRNTIIENEDMEELAEQIDTLNVDLSKKERQIKDQEETISYLEETVSQLEKKVSTVSVPYMPPQIIIEDPNGYQQCEDCNEHIVQKSALTSKLEELQNASNIEIENLKRKHVTSVQDNEELSEKIRKNSLVIKNLGLELERSNPVSGGCLTDEETKKLQQECERLKHERDEAKSLANAKIRTFYNKMFEQSGTIYSAFSELKQSKMLITEDLNNIKLETDDQIQHILQLISHHHKSARRTSLSKTSTSKTSSSTQTNALSSDTVNVNDNDPDIDSLKIAHTKELFEAKVKLKEMEAKLSHFHKKVKVLPYKHNENVACSESEKKLAEALFLKDEELRNARRLHGQNLATIRRSHDRTIKELQNKLDAMEINIREFIPNSNGDVLSDDYDDHEEIDNPRKPRSMILPRTPGISDDTENTLRDGRPNG